MTTRLDFSICKNELCSFYGPLAQLGERRPCKAEVASSNLVGSTNTYGVLAQLGERHTGSVEVIGSNPLYSTKEI